MGKKNYGKSVKTRLLNLMNETGYKYMLQTQQDKQVPAFSYEVFDRQLDHFTMMLKVLMDGWEDYSSQEMTFDIHSLCTKAARLCYLADQDLALQHSDVSHHRKEQNEM